METWQTIAPGDRVRITDMMHMKNATTGTVTHVGRMGRWVDVTWDSGNASTYDSDTLTIITNTED